MQPWDAGPWPELAPTAPRPSTPVPAHLQLQAVPLLLGDLAAQGLLLLQEALQGQRGPVQPQLLAASLELQGGVGAAESPGQEAPAGARVAVGTWVGPSPPAVTTRLWVGSPRACVLEAQDEL